MGVKGLEQLVESFPRLKALATKLGPNYSVTREFVDAYLSFGKTAGNQDNRVKGLFMDQLFGAGEPSDEVLERAFQYVKHLADRFLEGKGLASAEIPMAVFKLLGHKKRVANPRVLYNALARTYFGSGVDYLRELYRLRILSEDDAFKLIKEKAAIAEHNWFLDTGVLQLDFMNSVVYTQALLLSKLKPGGRQSKIPHLLSDNFKISRSSPVELYVMVDLWNLVYDGVVDLDTVDPKETPAEGLEARMKILKAIREMADNKDMNDRILKGFDDLDTIMARPELSWLLTPEKSEMLRKPGPKEPGDEYDKSYHRMKYTTGLYFNMGRLIGDIFPKFRPYYDAVSDELLKREILDHFRGLKRSVAARKYIDDHFMAVLDSCMDDYEGIGKRDIANILWHVHYMRARYGLKDSEILPPVAKYKLGLETDPGKQKHKANSPGCVANASGPRGQRRAYDIPEVRNMFIVKRPAVSLRNQSRSAYSCEPRHTETVVPL